MAGPGPRETQADGRLTAALPTSMPAAPNAP